MLRDRPWARSTAICRAHGGRFLAFECLRREREARVFHPGNPAGPSWQFNEAERWCGFRAGPLA